MIEVNGFDVSGAMVGVTGAACGLGLAFHADGALTT